jgi:hypothetical protein
MTDHQCDAGAARGGNDRATLLDAGRNRLLDQDVDTAGDAFQRQVVMKMGGSGYGDGVDPLAQQSINVGEGGAAERASYELPLLDVRIGNTNELDSAHIGKNAGVIAAHNANAYDPNFQWSLGASSGSLSHNSKGPLDNMLRPDSPLAWSDSTGDPPKTGVEHVLLQKFTSHIGNSAAPNEYGTSAAFGRKKR